MKKNNLIKIGAVLIVTSTITLAGINSARKENNITSSKLKSRYLSDISINNSQHSIEKTKSYINEKMSLKHDSEDFKEDKNNTLESLKEEQSLSKPTLSYIFKNIRGDSPYYKISIDNRMCGQHCKNGITGWELYVTTDENPGDEMIIDGIGYFLHSDNVKDNTITVKTSFNREYRYRARTYLDLNNKRIYSNWSDIITISPELKVPVLDNQFINVDNGHPTYDINIDYASYRIDEESYISGWELYVTTDENPGDEMIIDGIGYFLYGKFENEAVTNVLTSFNETYKYRARVFIECEGGERIYSDYSDIMSVSPKLKAPVLGNEYLETNDNVSLYDVYIDYASYRLNPDEENYLSGWELYVTTDENPGDEMIIDGVGYFLHSINGNETIREVIVDNTRAYKYRARVYIENEDGKIYSDFSSIMTITGK